MPKALITIPSGATVSIEGTQEEVAALLGVFEHGQRGEGRALDVRPRPTRQEGKSKTTPMGLLSDLIASGFFATPKELGAVKGALEEQGQFYPVTTLSPLMLRLVRKKELRRIKDKKRWTYVG
jgi:hypothetical protein